MRKLYIIIFLLFAFCLLNFSFLFALETDTHENINEFIVRNTLNGFSLDDYLRDQLGFSEGYDEKFKLKKTMKVLDWIKIGGKLEDIPYWYMLYLRSVNHFHNPLTDQGFSGIWGTGFLSGDSSIQWSQKSLGTQSPGGHYSWFDVRDYFYKALTTTDKTTRETNFADTFRGLGQLMHLVQDLSVPEHTRDDGHYLGVLPFYEHYEKWVKKHPDIVLMYPAISFDSSLIGNPNPLASVPIANLFDTNQYVEPNPDPAVTLRADIGLSEYTNANFLSPGTMFTSDFPYPNKEDCVLYRDEVNDRQYLRSDGNGEKVNHLAVVSWLYFWRTTHFPQYDSYLPLGLDPFCYQDYASYLIPRAVGYSAILLDYFFRGEIDMLPDDEAGGYVIVNKTEEEMEGTFELYYNNNYDERIQLWQMEFTLGPFDPNNPDSGDNKSYNIYFDEPDNAKEPGKYILVFKGRLGNETDAVVGRVIMPPFYLRILIDGDYITYGRIEFQIKWWGLDGVQHTENHIIPGDREEYTSPGGTTYRYWLVDGPFYLSEIDFDKPWAFRLYRDRNDMNPDNTSLCQSWSGGSFSNTAYSDNNGNWASVYTDTTDEGGFGVRQKVSYYYLTNWTFAAVYEDPEGYLLLADFSDETFFPFQDFDFYCNQCCVDGIKYWDLPEDPDYQGDQPVMLYGKGYSLCYEDERSHVESKTGLTFGSTRYSIVTYLDLEVTIDREDVEDNMWVPNNPMVTYYSVSRNPDNPDFKGWVYDLNLEYGIKSRTAGKTITQDSPQPMDTADIDQLFGIGHSYKYGGRKWFYGNNNWPFPNNNPYEWGWSGGRIYNKYFSERWLPILRYNSDEDRVYWEPEFLQEIRDYIHPMDIIWFGIKHYPVNVVANPSYATLMCWNPWVPFGDTGWEDAKMWQAYFLGPVTFIPDTPFDDIGPTILPADGGPMPSGELECKYDLQREVAWWVIGHQGGNYYPGQCEEPTTITEHHEVRRRVAPFVY